MRKLVFVSLLAVLMPFVAAAQSKERHGQGYVFVAPGTTSEGGATLQVGVGGEGLVYKGLGLGAEIGYLGAVRGLGEGVGVLSPNVSYNFLNASKSGRFAPFVTGGYSMFFRSGALNAVNFGGGMHWWFKDHLGLRLELRDHVLREYSSVHIVGFRIGLAFR